MIDFNNQPLNEIVSFFPFHISFHVFVVKCCFCITFAKIFSFNLMKFNSSFHKFFFSCVVQNDEPFSLLFWRLAEMLRTMASRISITTCVHRWQYLIVMSIIIRRVLPTEKYKMWTNLQTEVLTKKNCSKIFEESINNKSPKKKQQQQH